MELTIGWNTFWRSWILISKVFVYVQIFVHAHLMVQQFECDCVRKCVCGCVNIKIFYFDPTFYCKHVCRCGQKSTPQQFPCSFPIFTKYLWDIRSMKFTCFLETQVPIDEELSFKKYFSSLWTFLKWTCLPWTSIDLDPNFVN